MLDVPWDRRILNEFKSLAILTDDESLVLEDWVIGKSITFTSMHLCVSTRTVDNLRKSIRRKYDLVQPQSNILPERKPHL